MATFPCSCLYNARQIGLKLPDPDPSLCDCLSWKRKCQKLRIVVVTSSPFNPTPLKPYAPVVRPPATCPPSPCLINAGLARNAKVSGPGAYPTTVPEEILLAYPIGKKMALMYDFGKTQSGNGSAKGKILAQSAGSCTQASLEFKYTWCGVETCTGGGIPPRFEVTKCTFNGMKYSVLDDTTFVSFDPCMESTIILSLQQYCPPSDCVVCPSGKSGLCAPTTPSTTCDGTADKCVFQILPCGTFGPTQGFTCK